VKQITTFSLRIFSNAAIAVVFGILLAGCYAPKVHTAKNGLVDFSRYKTFGVLPLSAAGSGVDPVTVAKLPVSATHAVQKAMTARGLSEVARQKADCVVNVRGEMFSHVVVSDWGYTAPIGGPARRGWVYRYPDTNVHKFENRRLIVDIYDNSSHEQVWTGWVEDSSIPGSSVNLDAFEQKLHKILEKVPSAVKVR